ncbi:MAG: HAD family acid phosphatase [Ignavibacteriaceae bacterium]
MTKNKHFLYLIIFFFFYSAPLFPQKLDPSIKLENLSLLKDKIIQYHSSGQYDKDMQIICSNAWNKLKTIKPASNSAVVFDVDETVLSNYSFLKTMDFGYIPFLWDKWIDSAKAPAIKPVKALYDSVMAKGFKIIFISGRKDYQDSATINNLKDQGFTTFDTLILKKDNDLSTTTSLFKERKRIDLTKKGYHIICSIGDQFSDMYGKYTGLKVKLVDYMYFIK